MRGFAGLKAALEYIINSQSIVECKHFARQALQGTDDAQPAYNNMRDGDQSSKGKRTALATKAQDHLGQT